MTKVKGIITPILVLFGLMLIIVLHRPDMLLNPQPWAEDAAVFLVQTLSMGVSSLFEPYAGYYHVVPRIIFLLSYTLSDLLGQGISLFPLFSNVFAIIISSFCAIFICHRMFEWVAPLRWRIMCAGLICLMPHSPEVFGSATNLQWWFGIVIFLVVWDMLVNNRFPSKGIITASIIISLSTPLGVFFALASIYLIINQYVRKHPFEILKNSLVKGLLLSSGFIFQLTEVLKGRPMGKAELQASETIQYMINYLFGGIFARSITPNFSELVNDYGFSTFVFIGTILCIVIYLLNKDRKKPIIMAYLYLMLLTLVTYQGSKPFIASYVVPFGDGAGRYLFGPIGIVVILLVFTASRIKVKSNPVPAIFLSLVLITGLVEYKFTAFTDYDWVSSTKNFNINAGNICEAKINPEGWSYKFPCG